MPETVATAMLRYLYFWAIPFGIVVMGYCILRAVYCPRSTGEWKRLFADSESRKRLRERKARLDAIRSRRPGSILPGIPTSQRDFALEPLIRNKRFKEARAYIMEQIRHIRESPGATGRMRVYIQIPRTYRRRSLKILSGGPDERCNPRARFVGYIYYFRSGFLSINSNIFIIYRLNRI